MGKGGNGSHWGGCWRVHHDCAVLLVEHLQGEVAGRDTLLDRMGDREEALRAELAALKATSREPLPGEIDHEMLVQHNDALKAELAALKATLEDCHRQVEHAEAEVKSERLLTAVWRVHIERQNGELAALKERPLVGTYAPGTELANPWDIKVMKGAVDDLFARFVVTNPGVRWGRLTYELEPGGMILRLYPADTCEPTPERRRDDCA